jgi:hypothetical protein
MPYDHKNVANMQENYRRYNSPSLLLRKIQPPQNEGAENPLTAVLCEGGRICAFDEFFDTLSSLLECIIPGDCFCF